LKTLELLQTGEFRNLRILRGMLGDDFVPFVKENIAIVLQNFFIVKCYKLSDREIIEIRSKRKSTNKGVRVIDVIKGVIVSDTIGTYLDIKDETFGEVCENETIRMLLNEMEYD